MTIEWHATGSGVQFLGAVSLLDGGPAGDAADAVHLLRELVDNGQASFAGTDILVTYDELVELSPPDLRSLGLPEFVAYTLRVSAVGTLNDNSLVFNWGFYEAGRASKLDYRRLGAFLFKGDEPQSMASKRQYWLLHAIDEFNTVAPAGRSLAGNLEAFAKIKSLAIGAGAVLDKYLENESAVLPKRIELDLRRTSDDGISVHPVIDEDSGREFTEKFDKFPTVRDAYTLSDGEGARTRFVFSEKQREALEVAKSMKNVQGDQLDDFVEHPEAFFDPDVIDLDSFSSRVAEIGFYKPKYSAFISPYQSDWAPVLLIESAPGVRESVEIDNRERLEELETLFLDALRTGKNEVRIDEHNIPVVEVQKLLDLARENLEKLPKSTGKLPTAPEDGKKVLLIKENIESLEYVEEFRADPNIEHRLENPPNLATDFRLLPHQQEGVAWLQGAHRAGIPGVLLADDMGLGKTLQVLALIDWIQCKKKAKANAFLIVAPVSLLENWQEEQQRFFPNSSLKIVPIYGADGQRFVDDVSREGGLPKENGQSLLCLTTYETLRKQQKSLCRCNWECVALDEAQRIKTPGTLVTNAAKALKARFKIAITGTPIENSFLDIWCVMDFCVPGLLGSAKSFAERYQRPLRKEGTDVPQLGEALRQEIGVHLKRRFKTDVAKDLPEKFEFTRELRMPNVQLSRYKDILERVHKVRESGFGDKGYMLQAIAEMRAVSNHPYLNDDGLMNHSLDELVKVAARLQLVVHILREVSGKGEKCIVFSDSRPMQQLLAKTIESIFGLPYVSIINGSTPAAAAKRNASKLSRQQTIAKFQGKDGFNVIVMSPLAAGVGLNVVGANHVVHFSRHWNPAKEAQATDRAYRIGQTKNVHVHYLLAIADEFETFDVVLHKLLEKKQQLASASLYPSEMVEVRDQEMFNELF